MAYKARRGGQGRSQGGAADRLRRLDEYHRQVAERLIEQIEKGTAPWTQAWAPGEQALPANVQTGKAYRGGNSVWLMSVAEQRGYDDHRWGTYNQVKGLGGQVQRGETGTRILYWHFEDRRAARDSRRTAAAGREGRDGVRDAGTAVAARVHLHRLQRGRSAMASRPGRRGGAPGRGTPRRTASCKDPGRGSSMRAGTGRSTTSAATASSCRSGNASPRRRATTRRRYTSWATGRGTRAG